MKLKVDEALSNVAFNFNLRRYTTEDAIAPRDAVLVEASRKYRKKKKVERCRSTV